MLVHSLHSPQTSSQPQEGRADAGCGAGGLGAGPTIGLWDRQQGVPGPHDAPLMAHTCWAIELNVAVTVAEWGGSRMRVMLEEDAHFDGEQVHWLDGRQTELLLVR